MSGVKVKDIAYGRLQAPDLDVMEEFLTNFGMVRVGRTANALYMRGTDPAHHIHVTEKGPAKFIGLAWYAQNEDGLKAAAKLPGASGIETIDEPGGGRRVRLKEPNGYQIEIVHGIEALPPVPVRYQQVNSGVEPIKRAGETMRLRKGPSQVKRIAHGVVASPDVLGTTKWFRENLGLLRSDDVYIGSPDNILGTFSRADCGDEYVDHHAFFCFKHDHAGLNHLSFEVHDIDDVFLGHEHLQRLGKYEHLWGIGRHLLGSQVYDYWADPWGRGHEHWADSDRLNAKNGGNMVPIEEGLASQWGDQPPEKFMHLASP
jgi:catechol 2,3-dioxygenase-like lactoylglutathione lyase family enzyme